MRNKIMIAVICFALAPLAAVAEDPFAATMVKKLDSKIPPVDQFKSAVAGAIMMCGITRTLNTQIAESQALGIEVTQDKIDRANYRECIKRHRAVLTGTYGLVSNTLKKPAQKAALKEYHVLAISTLEGIVPSDSERLIDYERRTSAEKRALDVQGVRLDTEM